MSMVLNRDILEEIVPHFNVTGILSEKEAVKALKKFMLSGKEPYEAALRHFSHVDAVIIKYISISIVVKRHILREDLGSNVYKLPYDFSFLDDILGVVEKSNTKLDIEGYPSSAAGRKALARLTQKHLKYVDFDDCNDLPADYYKFFKNECSFDDSRLDLCCVKKPTLSQFFELTSTDRSIITHFEKFFRRMPSTKRIFPAVQSLSFHPCFCEEDFGDFPFVFTTATVKDFSNLLVESMPNLTNVVANFSAQPEQRMFSWKRVYNEMKKFTPEMFEHIPSKVKGSLNFYVVDNHESLKKIIELIPKTNPGVDFDLVNKQLVKKFDIHDGLTFDFTLQLSEEESEDEFSSENESDEMEEEEEALLSDLEENED